MTLCKYRPLRTYDAQYILEQNDVNGLMKVLDQTVGELVENGDALTPYYVGARLAVGVLVEVSERTGEVDKWTDFMRAFGEALEILGGDGE